MLCHNPHIYKVKVRPGGGELQTPFCTVTVPRGAVTMRTKITCEVINPNDVILPLKDGEMLVSDIIELGPHGKTFHKPVTVQIQYSSASSGAATVSVVWVTEDSGRMDGTKDTISVSVDHSSIFAVISRPKHDQFTASTAGHTLTSSTQPAVQISFPEEDVNTETKVKLKRAEDLVISTATEGMIMTDLTGVGEYFYFIKENVSSNWKDLAHHLGFKWADIENIAAADGNNDDKSRCMDMLQEWKTKKGDAATIEVLMEALSEAGLQSVVDGLKKFLLQGRVVNIGRGILGDGGPGGISRSTDPGCTSLWSTANGCTSL
ncbi:positive regulation of extrinsic apoptotic signaling pathway via death domain receptors protein [Branchiostoma belcheri]|nr:positive regulation of extrinsic apoptotic signaling pathway via death domain receptors protein [Branchiostoma belcheri]